MTDTGAAGAHAHPLPASYDQALLQLADVRSRLSRAETLLADAQGQIADLDARVATLESGTPPIPGPEPGPTPDVTFGPPTGADQSAELAAFIRANAGKTIALVEGAVYKIESRIALEGLRDTTILLRGATLYRQARASAYEQFRLRQCAGLTFDLGGGTVRGPASLADIESRVFGPGDQEGEHAFGIESCGDIVIRNGRITNTWGDAAYLRAQNSSGVDSPSSGVVLEDLVLDIIGRNGISVISATDLLVSRVRCSHAALHGFDCEPNRSTDVAARITIADSDWRAFDVGHTASGPGYAIVLTPGYADVQVADIAILRNTMDRPRVRVDGYSAAAPARNVTVTGNRPDVAGDATFTHVTGLVFSDNGLMGYEATP